MLQMLTAGVRITICQEFQDITTRLEDCHHFTHTGKELCIDLGYPKHYNTSLESKTLCCFGVNKLFDTYFIKYLFVKVNLYLLNEN